MKIPLRIGDTYYYKKYIVFKFIFGRIKVIDELRKVYYTCMEEKKDDYIKTMKNVIVTISSIVFGLNVFCSPDFLTILLSSFTYISSQGLTFYSLNPNTEKAKHRRTLLVKGSIWMIGIIVMCLIIVDRVSFSDIAAQGIELLVKLLLLAFGLCVICFSFADGSETVTKNQLKMSKLVHQDLNEQYAEEKEGHIFLERNKRSENNKSLRYFVENKKSKKKEEHK